MTTPMPGDGRSLLKDFLYVDLPRVRSFLGQLYAGTPEKVEEIQERLNRWSVGASLGLVKGDAGKQTTTRSQETRSFGDLHFSMFEEAAEAVGFLRDISDVARSGSNWTNGILDRDTPEGSIIRITAPTTITDAQHFTNMIDQVFGSGIIPQDDTGITPAMMSALIKAMYTPGISIRIAPVGETQSDYALTGTLLERSEHIEPERASLYERYGTGFREWTTVAIVARKGTQQDAANLSNLDFGMQNGRVDRAAFESAMKQFTTYMEATGLTEAPVYPGLAIIPLGVYRVIEQPRRAIAL